MVGAQAVATLSLFLLEITAKIIFFWCNGKTWKVHIFETRLSEMKRARYSCKNSVNKNALGSSVKRYW